MLSFCDCEAVELTIIIVVNEPYPVQIMDEFVFMYNYTLY